MRHRWTDFSRGLWLVGPREANPQNTLRQAKGVAPLRSVALRSRSGTLSYFDLNAHSMTRFNDKYVIGAGTDLYTTDGNRSIGSEVAIPAVVAGGPAALDGTRLTFVQMPPTSSVLGDAEIPDYLFIAGGGSLMKLDSGLASTPTRWGIDPPDYSNGAGADMLAQPVAQSSTNIDLFNVGDPPTGWSVPTESDSYTLSADTGRKIEGAQSLRMQMTRNGSYITEKDLTGAPLDLTTVGASPSAPEDYITFSVRVNRPKHIKSIEIAFDVVATAPIDLFKTKYFSRELKVQVVRKKRKKFLIGTGDIIRPKDQKKFLAGKKDLPLDRSLQEQIKEDTIGVVRRRWTRVTLPKLAFDTSGGADHDTDWSNVRGIRITVETNRLGAANVNVDSLQLVGGVGTQGKYQYHVTFRNTTTGTRSNPDLTTGPISATTAAGDIADIERQGIQLTNVPTAPTSGTKDPQVDQREIWRTLGNGEVFFLAGTIDDNTTTTFTDTTSDYIGMFEGATNILDDEELPTDNIVPESTYEDAAGPHLARMWWGRDTQSGGGGRLYFSPVGRAEAVEGFIYVSSDEDPIQKVLVFDQQLFVFTIRHVYRIVGVDESTFRAVAVFGAPGTTQPFTVQATPSGIAYVAIDGPRLFDGATSRLIAEDALAPIFRNATTDGITTAFAPDYAAWGRGEYYVTDSSSASTTTLAVDDRTGAWRNLGFPANFLFYDAESNILFGGYIPTTVGDVLVIRPATHAGSMTFTSAAPFIPFGAPFISGSITHNDARVLVPRNITITRLSAVPIAVPAAGQTVTLQFNVDGTTDTSMQLSFTNADSANVAKSVTGTVAVTSGSTLSIETTYAGGAASLQFRSVGIAYSVTVE